MLYTYQYPRPALGVDCLVLRPGVAGLQLLLIERGNPPFEGMWALPGGFFDMDDADTAATAARELLEETGLATPLQLLGPFSAKGRDPRERTVTIAYYGFAAATDVALAGDDAAGAAWHPLDALPPLAFDHANIIAALQARLQVQPA